MEWFRWYSGATTDPKFLVVSRLSGQNVAAVLAVWAMLLERASDASIRGDASGFDCDGADALLGLEDGAACTIVKVMEARGLLTNGRVTNWSKRQPKREDDSAERVREHRARKRAEEATEATEEAVKRSVTHGNAVKRSVTHGNARGEEIREIQEIQDSNLTSFDCLSSPDGDDTNPPCPDGQKAERQESLLPDSMPEDENVGTQENSSGDEPLQHEEQKHNGGPPPCPYEQIRDMYHEVFPEHPRVALLNNKRRGAVKARWGDAGVRLRELKRPDSAAERLAYFQRLFLRAARSDFLTGKKSFPNGDVYRVTFDKLMSPGGFIGVIEGKYDNQQEAYA